MLKSFIDLIEWKKKTKYHWQTWFQYQLLDYWPTTEKWGYKKEIHEDGLEDLLKKQCFEDEKALTAMCCLVPDRIIGDNYDLMQNELHADAYLVNKYNLVINE